MLTKLPAARFGVIGLAVAAVLGVAAPAGAATSYQPGARDVDWANATLTLPNHGARCPGGTLTFAEGSVSVDTDAVRESQYWQSNVVFGDLDRDGRDDALLAVTCVPMGDADYSLPAVYAFTAKGGAPALLGVVTAPVLHPDSYQIRGGAAIVKARDGRDNMLPVIPFRFRFDGKAFQEVSGKAAYTYDWTSAPVTLPFNRDEALLWPATGGRGCPKVTAEFTSHFAGSRGGSVKKGDFWLNVAPRSFGDVNHDGVTDMVVEFSCLDDEDAGMASNRWLYVYTMKHGKPAPLGFLTAGACADGSTPIITSTIGANGRIQVTQGIDVSDQDRQVTREFRWTGAKFRAGAPLPAHTGSDVAP